MVWTLLAAPVVVAYFTCGIPSAAAVAALAVVSMIVGSQVAWATGRKGTVSYEKPPARVWLPSAVLTVAATVVLMLRHHG